MATKTVESRLNKRFSFVFFVRKKNQRLKKKKII